MTPAHSPSQAYLVALALLLDPSEPASSRQLEFLQRQLGGERAKLVGDYYGMICRLGPRYRLPLLEISFPALKLSPVQQLEYLLDLGRRLIELDGRVDFREFCFYRILSRTLSQAADPSAQTSRQRASKAAVREAAVMLISLLADRGQQTDAKKREAFRAGIEPFGRWAGDGVFRPASTDAVRAFDRSLDILDRMNGAATRTLLRAVVATVVHDGKVNVAEAEMIRAICASLNCPLPPMLTDELENP